MSVGTSEKFYAIGQKHQLSIEQVEILSKQAGLVMLGFEHPSKFIGNIARALEVPEEKVRAIAEDINVEIFRPVRESLRKIHGIQEVASKAPEVSQTKELPKPPPLPMPRPQGASGVGIPTAAPRLVGTLPVGLEENKISNENKGELNREEILRDIENPVRAEPTPPLAGQAGNIVQEKLAGLVRMPKSETDLSKRYSADPYREPLN